MENRECSTNVMNDVVQLLNLDMLKLVPLYPHMWDAYLEKCREGNQLTVLGVHYVCHAMGLPKQCAMWEANIILAQIEDVVAKHFRNYP